MHFRGADLGCGKRFGCECFDHTHWRMHSQHHGLLNGRDYILKVTQGGSGSNTLALGSGCTWKVSGGGGGAVPPTTAVGTIDILAFTYDGPNCYANYSKDFKEMFVFLFSAAAEVQKIRRPHSDFPAIISDTRPPACD